MSHTDDLLNSAETAAILGIRINTLEIWRVRGNGPAFIKLGDHARSSVRYRRSDVIAWIEKRLYASTSAHSAALVAAQRLRPHAVDAIKPVPALNGPWLKVDA